MIGSTIGTYRVLRAIGQGGMGTVYLAEHVLLGRHAALKVLLPSYSLDQEIVRRFFNEARAISSLSDPGIVQIFDFGVHSDGSAYIVMELLEGEPLDARLRRHGRLVPLDAVRLVRQCAGSLAVAHARGIIHRDLKPENLFAIGDPAVTGGERIKILDFGIAKLIGDDVSTSRTRTGVLIGTPIYMSPEQCRGLGEIDVRSDVYSLGCVLFALIAGRPPFVHESSGELIVAHLREVPPALGDLVPGVPRELDEVVQGCLAKTPSARHASMQALAHALDVVMATALVPAASYPAAGAAASYPSPGASYPPPAGAYPAAGASYPPPAGAYPSPAGSYPSPVPPPPPPYQTPAPLYPTPAPSASPPRSLSPAPSPSPSPIAMAARAGPHAATTLGTASGAASTASTASTASARRRSLVIAVSALAVIALVLGGWLVRRRAEPDRPVRAAATLIDAGVDAAAVDAGDDIPPIDAGVDAAAIDAAPVDAAVDAPIDAARPARVRPTRPRPTQEDRHVTPPKDPPAMDRGD